MQWLVHWPLTGGLLHLVQQEGDWAGLQPAQAPPCCTKCNSPPINGQCTVGLPTSYYSMQHYNCLWILKGLTAPNRNILTYLLYLILKNVTAPGSAVWMRQVRSLLTEEEKRSSAVAQRGRAMIIVVDNFTVTQSHSRLFEVIPLSRVRVSSY